MNALANALAKSVADALANSAPNAVSDGLGNLPLPHIPYPTSSTPHPLTFHPQDEFTTALGRRSRA